MLSTMLMSEIALIIHVTYTIHSPNLYQNLVTKSFGLTPTSENWTPTGNYPITDLRHPKLGSLTFHPS